MSFAWAKDYPDVEMLCRLFGLYELDDISRHYYKKLNGIIQNGPQCGLVALAISMENPKKETIQEIYEYARENKITNNGEVFSVTYMEVLAKKFLRNRVEIYNGALNSEKIIKFLLDKGQILVPYDCDRNYTPCLMQGHRAHWAIVSGVLEAETAVYVVAKQGKSLNTAIWNLSDLSDSNQQLVQVSSERIDSELVYIVPEGGLAGPNGLCGKSLLIYPVDKS